jgi:hypothetical protein
VANQSAGARATYGNSPVRPCLRHEECKQTPARSRSRRELSHPLPKTHLRWPSTYDPSLHASSAALAKSLGAAATLKVAAVEDLVPARFRAAVFVAVSRTALGEAVLALDERFLSRSDGPTAPEVDKCDPVAGWRRSWSWEKTGFGSETCFTSRSARTSSPWMG